MHRLKIRLQSSVARGNASELSKKRSAIEN
jgi:hypothetical protein